MEAMDRRGFVGAMGAVGGMGVMGGILAGMGVGADAALAAGDEAGVDVAQLNGAPMNAVTMGNPNGEYWDTFAHMENPVMTREQALDFIYNPVMATEDLTLPDGTVIPAVYLNLRNRWNRIGVGVGSAVDAEHDFWTKLMAIYTEEEAAQYLELPILKVFTVTEYAQKSGRSVEEATQICENFAMKGVLPRFTRAGVPHYYLTNQWLGGCMHSDDPTYAGGLMASDWSGCQYDGGTPIYQVVPISEDVVADTEILPLDDWRAAIERNSIFVIVPCACRAGIAAGQGDFEYMKGEWETRLNDDDRGGHHHRINTCLAMGELAEYYKYFGYGWEITKEEAIASSEQSVDEGMVIEHFYGKACEVICNCHVDNCGLLGALRACDGIGDAVQVTSNYKLNLDKDACIKCGACVDRCAMHSVSFDDDGYPQMDMACARCGVCVPTCPAGARSLTAQPKELRDDAADTMWDDWSEKPIYRAMRGQLVDFVG